MERIFPQGEWTRAGPANVGINADALAAAGEWLVRRAGDRSYRAVVVRSGAVVAELNHGLEAGERLSIASAAKSVFGCLLGIAVAEGVIGSADDRAVDYYPEMMDVPDGAGPKPGRFARDKDRGITLRQLISNTSGYLKPGEPPGEVFHYQTFGMNILCHAIATAYGRYDSREPDRLGGAGSLIQEKIRDPIGGSWSWVYANFDLWDAARLNIFGNYTQLHVTALDMARLGWLWCTFGRWGDRQVVPEAWLRESAKVNPAPAVAEPGSEGKYGQGFWSNEQGRCWPGLPADSFAAAGAGAHLIWCCPGLDLVVVEGPGVYEKLEDEADGFLSRVVAACAD